jgi:hypothetical protein
VPKSSAFAGRLAGLTLTVVLAACSGSECVSGPLCDDGGGTNPPPSTPTIATIGVVSPIDSLLAVGRTTQLTATARDDTGAPVTATITWSSTNPAAATVSTSGLVTGVGPGATTIRAVSGSVTGAAPFRAVDADLPGLAAVLGDSFAAGLVGALSGAARTSVSGFLTNCSSSVTAGHIGNVEQCLDAIAAATGADANDTAVLAVLKLFVDFARTQLNLDR